MKIKQINIKKTTRAIRFELERQVDLPFSIFGEIVNTLLEFGYKEKPNPRDSKGGYVFYYRFYHKLREKYPKMKADFIVSAINYAEGVYKSWYSTWKKFDKKMKLYKERKKWMLDPMIISRKKNYDLKGLRVFQRRKSKPVPTIYKPKLPMRLPHEPKKPEFKNNVIRLKQSMFAIDFGSRTIMFMVERKKKFARYIKAKYHNDYIHGWIPKEAQIVRKNGKDIVFLYFAKKDVNYIKPKGFLALDINLDKIVGAYREHHKLNYITFPLGVWRHGNFIPMSAYLLLKRNAMRKIQKRYFNERRFRYIYERSKKYGKKYTDRMDNALKQTINQIVNFAIEKRLAILIEDIKHANRFRNKSKMGNYLTRHFPYFKFKQLIVSEASANGIYLFAVNPRYTSQTCPRCGEKVENKGGDYHTLICPNGHVWDRDELAATNILLRGERDMVNEYRKEGIISFQKGFPFVMRCSSHR